MSRSQPDPLKDFLVDLFGSDKPKDSAQIDKPAVGKFRPIAPLFVVVAVLMFATPHLLALSSGVEGAGQVIDSRISEAVEAFVGFRWLASVAAVAACAGDLWRYIAHRHRVRIDAVVRQATQHLPKKVSVGFPPGLQVVRTATVKLAPGAIIRPKEMELLTTSLRETTGRIRGKWVTAAAWQLSVTHQAHKDRIVIARKDIEPDLRSDRHKLLARAVKTLPFEDPAVSVSARDESGEEIAYKIMHGTSASAGLAEFQKKVERSLVALSGDHPSGRTWIATWYPDQDYLELTLRTPLPKRVDHPIFTSVTDPCHIPYATAEGDRIMYWDISTKSNKPHALIVGPTGGGKTSVIRSLLTEASRRGIPFIGVDPKRIELDGLEGYPGCLAIVNEKLRAAMLIRALCDEMDARYRYVKAKKIEPSQLPLLIVVLDEFFILSGQWQRAKEEVGYLDPLGGWADLAVLARSAGIRLLLGVQRPDASLFGGASGNARDNFGTRISLGNLSQDGAMMLWGDSQVGREIDSSVPGRGVALGQDGKPVDAQMWWTPNVDPHPNKWQQLSAAEQDMIDALRPTTNPESYFYSKELREFVESERAMATVSRDRSSVREPTILGQDPVLDDLEYDDDDDFADAIPASAVTEGMTVLIDDGNGNDREATVAAVTVIRDKGTGDVIETTLTFNGTGRVKNHITYGPHEVVILPEPDNVLTPA